MAERVEIIITAANKASPDLRRAAADTAAIGDAARKSGSAVSQFTGSLTSGIAGMLGPAAAAAAALAGLASVAQSFASAFQLKASLDTTTNAINLQLRGVRDSSVVWAEAARFASAYNLTQMETARALQLSVQLMRVSTSSAEDLLGTLVRLSQLNPAEGIEGAAFALKELASGDTTSLKERFNVGRDAANEMKAEIVAGGDAIQVMSRYLEDVGLGMDALAGRTEGATGKMLELAKAQEEFALAQAEWAQGPGMAWLQFTTEFTTGATRVLGGAGGMEMGLRAAGLATTELEGGFNRLEETLLDAHYNLGLSEVAAVRLRDRWKELAQTGGTQVRNTLIALVAAFDDDRISSEDLSKALQALEQDQKNTAIAAAAAADAADVQASALAGVKINADLAGAALARLSQKSRGAVGGFDTGTANLDRLGGKAGGVFGSRTNAAGGETFTTGGGGGRDPVAAARDTYAREQQALADHYARMRQTTEDYLLRRDRSQEDYEARRRRLLAEGRRFEAQQLADEFGRDQRRAAEDYAIGRRRANESAGIEFAPLVIKLDVAGVEQQFLADLRAVAATAPPQPNGGSGGRP